MNCSQCGNKIGYGHVAIAHEVFCSDVCHLRFWKVEMPNLGGGFISDEDIATVEHLLGQARQAEYEKIVKFIFDNFDSTPIKRFFDQGSDNDQ